MISEAAGREHMSAVWCLLAAASAGTFLYAGIKFPWFVFFGKNSDLRPADPPLSMQLAMMFFAAVCIGIGVFPQALYALLPFKIDYIPYTASHVLFYLQLLLFSGLAFFLMLGRLKLTLTITLDVDWLYRGFGSILTSAFNRMADAAWNGIVRLTSLGARKSVAAVRQHHGPSGLLARSASTGTMAFWTAVMLASWLAASYL